MSEEHQAQILFCASVVIAFCLPYILGGLLDG